MAMDHFAQVGAPFLRLEDAFHLAPAGAPAHPHFPAPDIEDDGPVLAVAHVRVPDTEPFFFQKPCPDLNVLHADRRGVGVAQPGRHVGPPEKLHLEVPGLELLDPELVSDHLDHFVAIAPIQGRGSPSGAARQHVVAHRAGFQLRVPERHRHAGTEDRADARVPFAEGKSPRVEENFLGFISGLHATPASDLGAIPGHLLINYIFFRQDRAWDRSVAGPRQPPHGPGACQRLGWGH